MVPTVDPSFGSVSSVHVWPTLAFPPHLLPPKTWATWTIPPWPTLCSWTVRGASAPRSANWPTAGTARSTPRSSTHTPCGVAKAWCAPTPTRPACSSAIRACPRPNTTTHCTGTTRPRPGASSSSGLRRKAFTTRCRPCAGRGRHPAHGRPQSRRGGTGAGATVGDRACAWRRPCVCRAPRRPRHVCGARPRPRAGGGRPPRRRRHIQSGPGRGRVPRRRHQQQRPHAPRRVRAAAASRASRRRLWHQAASAHVHGGRGARHGRVVGGRRGRGWRRPRRRVRKRDGARRAVEQPTARLRGSRARGGQHGAAHADRCRCRSVCGAAAGRRPRLSEVAVCGDAAQRCRAARVGAILGRVVRGSAEGRLGVGGLRQRRRRPICAGGHAATGDGQRRPPHPHHRERAPCRRCCVGVISRGLHAQPGVRAGLPC